jgi:predicted transcriptional regulator
MLAKNPNRCGTCPISDIIHLLDSLADFAGSSAVAQLCLASCYEEKKLPNKDSRRTRPDEGSDPSVELLGSQPSTQGGSQPTHEVSLPIRDDIPEDK